FPPLPKPVQMLYLFMQSLPTSIVGALISLADEPSYRWYTLAPRIFGISAIDDQRLGGLIMWVPASMVYWISITIVFLQWFNTGNDNEAFDADAEIEPVEESGAEAAPSIA